MAEINKIHVAPGVYVTDSVDMKQAANSLGVTKLALVGETLKGPAFEPYWIHDPKEYANVFGGTSPVKFLGTNFPKYEAPYIAQEYLKASDQLCVVRVLGFSGSNMGPAWAITGSKDGQNKHVIAVLRSKGSYKFRPDFVRTSQSGNCQCSVAYDSLTYDVGETNAGSSCGEPKQFNKAAVALGEYLSLKEGGNNCSNFKLTTEQGGGSLNIAASSGNLGRFTIRCVIKPQNEGTTPDSANAEDVVTIPVSFNKGDNDYIENVLGTSPSDGAYPLYLETLYDVAWENLVMGEAYNKVDSELTAYMPASTGDYSGLEPVYGFLTQYDTELTKKDLGKRFLYKKGISPLSGVTSYYFDYGTNNAIKNAGDKDGLDGYESTTTFKEGQIYTVGLVKDSLGIRHYVYREYSGSTVSERLGVSGVEDTTATNYEEYIRAIDKIQKKPGKTLTNKFGSIVYNYEDGLFYKIELNGSEDVVTRIDCDLNDYKSSYRYSSTPWVVSNAKGDAKNIEVNKLFRFHTISDGKGSVTEVKVSIENIKPNTGEFDVVVRNYFDSDASPIVLERYSKCTMAQGKKFIGTMIGTMDGMCESRSKYITVEVAKSSAAVNSVPAGFLGYPIPLYSGATIEGTSHSGVTLAPIQYNKMYDEDVNKKKQYFGISDIVGYDADYFTYKGKMASIESPSFMSHGFHLDCRMDIKSYDSNSEKPRITVDGETDYIFDTVSVNARTSKLNQKPVIASEDDMYGSIFEDVKLRKFTMCFYGGYDGWDEYRDSRTNTNEYTASAYKGYINKHNGIGYAFDAFNTFNNSDLYNLDGGAITTDYYAYLAGVSMLKNPNEVDINLLATPGIDTVYNSRLMNDIFEILEERNDIFGIITTPDKEAGTGDFESDVEATEYAVSDFVDQELNCDYVATYYPWVKIEDNGQYLFVPPTKDIVRNMAESDNRNTTQNLAPAGTTRGRVNAIKARKNLKNDEADMLYEARINPVRTFAQEGLVVMGQKTLRAEEDPKNRIDVMRTMIRMRKLLSIATIHLVFEPDDNATIKSFQSIVNGVMQTFIDNRAIEKWKMNIDTSKEAEDRLEIKASIAFKPIRAIEYISFNLICTDKETYFE
jgi:hypothetical protein